MTKYEVEMTDNDRKEYLDLLDKEGYEHLNEFSGGKEKFGDIKISNQIMTSNYILSDFKSNPGENTIILNMTKDLAFFLYELLRNKGIKHFSKKIKKQRQNEKGKRQIDIAVSQNIVRLSNLLPMQQISEEEKEKINKKEK